MIEALTSLLPQSPVALVLILYLEAVALVLIAYDEWRRLEPGEDVPSLAGSRLFWEEVSDGDR